MSLLANLPDHMDHLLRNSVALDPLTKDFWLTVGEFGKPQIFPWKQYWARVDIPLIYQGEQATLITIAFRPWDGTGDMSTYREWELEIDPGFQFIENPSRVYPRAKNLPDWTPLPIEWIIPLFVTKVWERYVIPHNSTLLELWIVWKNAIWIIWRIQTYAKPSILLTVTGEWKDRFGDPHALYSPRESWIENGYQVAWFLSAKDRSSKVFELLSTRWKLPPNY